MHIDLGLAAAHAYPSLVGLGHHQHFGSSAAAMNSCCGSVRRVAWRSSFGTRAFGQLAHGDSSASRRWSRLFCSTPVPAQQHQQQQLAQQQDLNSVVRFEAAVQEAEPLVHSNPRIQVLLDRYRRLCEESVPTATQQIYDRSDSRSPSRAVFSNNLVDLRQVEVVGFDYDYTLATCERREKRIG